MFSLPTSISPRDASSSLTTALLPLSRTRTIVPHVPFSDACAPVKPVIAQRLPFNCGDLRSPPLPPPPLLSLNILKPKIYFSMLITFVGRNMSMPAKMPLLCTIKFKLLGFMRYSKPTSVKANRRAGTCKPKNE